MFQTAGYEGVDAFLMKVRTLARWWKCAGGVVSVQSDNGCTVWHSVQRDCSVRCEQITVYSVNMITQPTGVTMLL